MQKGLATVSLLTWVAGGAISLIASVALAFASSTNAGLNELSQKESNDNTFVVQRMSTVEAHYQDIDNRLIRIENKLDKISQ